jgi:hypothetical protein
MIHQTDFDLSLISLTFTRTGLALVPLDSVSGRGGIGTRPRGMETKGQDPLQCLRSQLLLRFEESVIFMLKDVIEYCIS